MDIEKLVTKIIPPQDYQNRNGFNNIPLIDKLTEDKKKALEIALIKRLASKSVENIDTLIIETLAYLRSQRSVPILKDLLEKSDDWKVKLIIATSIFEINKDSEMIDIAIASFRKIDNNKSPYYKYRLSSAFYYLAKFKNKKVKNLIKEYTKHKEYLVAYNAKRVLAEQF